MSWPLGLLAFSLGLLWLGWRGRRVGDHPTCRRCGFDLFGKPPESHVCSECGADLGRQRAVRIGHRRKRQRVIAFAVPVLLCSGAWLGLIGRGTAAKVNWIEYEPAWLLVPQADSKNASRRDAALLELLRRLQNGKLGRGTTDRLVKRALALQADASAPWSVVWGEFIEQARNTGDVADAQWERYWRQAFPFSLSAGGGAPAGRPLNVSITSPVIMPRYSGLPVGIEYRAMSLTVGGIQCDAAEWGGTAGAYDSATRASLGIAGPNERYYLARSGATWYLSSKDRSIPMVRARTRPGLANPTKIAASVSIMITPDREFGGLGISKSSISLPTDLTTLIRLPPDVIPVELVRTPSLRAGVEKSLHVDQVIMNRAGPEPDTYFEEFTIGGPAPPIDGCFDVELHQAGADFGWRMGTLECRQGQPSHFVFRHKITWHPNRFADVVFKPSAEKASQAGMEQIWGELVIVRVPVVGPSGGTGL